MTIYADGTAIGSATAAGTSTTVFTNGSRDLADGAHSITARETQSGKDDSGYSPALTITVDTVPPAAPSVPVLDPSTDSGVVGDDVTNVTKSEFTGTAEAGATVTILSNGVAVGSGTATGGNYAVTLTTALVPDAVYGITAQATDLAGNTGAASPPLSLTIDTTPPAAVDLQWSGPGSQLTLTENAAANTPGITLSEPSPTGNLLKVDLGAGYVFAGTSVASATGLIYQNGPPTNSQWATIDISLAGNVAAIAATLPGDGLTLGPIYDSLGGMGSITAAPRRSRCRASTRPSSAGSVDLKATGNLTVASGATINVGGGTLSLAADVQAGGGGDDGTGTLAVLANASVYAGTINLRGADVNIAPTANVGSPTSGSTQCHHPGRHRRANRLRRRHRQRRPIS